MVSGRGQIRAPITPLNHPIAAYIFFFLSFSSSSLPTSLHSYLLLNSSNKQELIQKTETPPAEFWYYLVYNRLPDDYTGINGYTKKHGFFDEYEALKKQERAKLRESAAQHESAAQRESAALHKPAAHPGSPGVEKQD